ncbi:MAG: hypothetical protein U0935_20965 [Pirellulales bacterium]
MKIAKTSLESVRVKWTIYGIAFAIATQACVMGINALRGKAVDWMDVFPTAAAVCAVVFAVQGAVYAAARLPKGDA